jgi:hypothetical protein
LLIAGSFVVAADSLPARNLYSTPFWKAPAPTTVQPCLASAGHDNRHAFPFGAALGAGQHRVEQFLLFVRVMRQYDLAIEVGHGLGDAARTRGGLGEGVQLLQ